MYIDIVDPFMLHDIDLSFSKTETDISIYSQSNFPQNIQECVSKSSVCERRVGGLGG